MERALVGELLDEVAQPKFPTLTREQLRLLRADRDEFFASLGPELMAWKRWAMNAPDWYLAKYAYGVDIKRKLLQLDYERAFPATQRLEVTTPRLSDAELVETLVLLGLVVPAGLPSAEGEECGAPELT